MGNLQPCQAAVRALPHAAPTRKVAGDVPRAMIEVSRVAWPEVVPLDHKTVQPEFPEQFNVGSRVRQVPVFSDVKFIGSTFHGAANSRLATPL
jgi:hypothetical protein